MIKVYKDIEHQGINDVLSDNDIVTTISDLTTQYVENNHLYQYVNDPYFGANIAHQVLFVMVLSEMDDILVNRDTKSDVYVLDNDWVNGEFKCFAALSWRDFGELVEIFNKIPSYDDLREWIKAESSENILTDFRSRYHFEAYNMYKSLSAYDDMDTTKESLWAIYKMLHHATFDNNDDFGYLLDKYMDKFVLGLLNLDDPIDHLRFDEGIIKLLYLHYSRHFVELHGEHFKMAKLSQDVFSEVSKLLSKSVSKIVEVLQAILDQDHHNKYIDSKDSALKSQLRVDLLTNYLQYRIDKTALSLNGWMVLYDQFDDPLTGMVNLLKDGFEQPR